MGIMVHAFLGVMQDLNHQPKGLGLTERLRESGFELGLYVPYLELNFPLWSN